MLTKKIASKNNEALWVNDENFHAMFVKHHAVMLVIEPESGRIMDANPAADKFYGHPAGRLRTMTIFDVNTLPTEEVARECQRALREEINYFIFPHRLASGEIRTVEVDSSPVTLGNHRLLFSIIHDITGHKQAEEMLQSIFVSSPDPITVVDLSGRIKLCSQSTADVHGYSSVEQLIGSSYYELISEEERPRAVEDMKQVMDHGYVKDVPFIGLKRNGEKFSGELSVSLLKDGSGGSNGIVGITKDVTKRKQAEAALKASNELVNNLIASMQDGLSVVDTKGVHLDVNPALCRMTGYSRDELIGSGTPHPYWPPEEYEHIQKAFQQTLKNETANFELTFRRKNGERFPVIVSPFAIKDKLGNIVNYSATIKDITAHKHAEEALRLRESYLTAILENQPGLVWLKDADGRFMTVNQSFADACGKASPAELTGKTDLDIWPKELAEKYQSDDAKVMKNKTPVVVEEPIFDHDKTTWFETFKTPVFDDKGNALGTTGYSREITERKKAESALRESEERYRRLAENASDVVCRFEFGPPYRVAYINSAVTTISGHSPAEFYEDPDLLGKLVYPDDLKYFEKINSSGPEFLHALASLRFIHKNGQIIWLELHNIPVKDENGRIIALESIGRDITERKRAEEVLRLSEANLKEAQRVGRLGSWDWDAVTDTIRWSEEYYRIYGFDPKQSPPKYEEHLKAYTPESAARLDAAVKKSMELGEPYEVDLELAHSDNLRKWVTARCEIKRDPNGQIIGLRGTAQDITERKQAENALRESEENLKLAILAGRMGTWSRNFVSGKLEWSPECKAMFGLPPETEMNDERFMNALHPDDREPTDTAVNDALKKQTNFNAEYRVIWPDGTIHWIAAQGHGYYKEDGQVIRMDGLTFDITERKRMEKVMQEYNSRLESEVAERTQELREAQEKLVRHEKLSVLGQMASSVGHELRNPLSVINSAIYYLKLIQPDASGKVKQYLDVIAQEVRTSDKIITDLLDFARIKSVDREVVSVSNLVQQTLERFPVPPTVNLILDIPEGLPLLFVDVHHLTQVLGNLTVNACQSMTSSDGASGGDLSLHSRVENDMIRITVTDSGVGIPPENMNKLFEPLFTTKPKGIGLGLSVSQKLTQANGGRIEVQSEPGKGSSFSVYLPIYEETK